MNTKLNEEELKKVLNFLHLNDTLRMLLNNYKEQYKEDVVDHLNGHYTFVRGILMDLGEEFNEIEKIRSLNVKIRELEKSFSNAAFDNTTVSSYIGAESQKFSDFFKQHGIRGSFSYKFTPEISAGFSIFSARQDDENFNRLIKNFDLFNTRDDEYYQLSYTQNNINKLDALIYDYFGSGASIEYSVRTYFSDKTPIAGISAVSIYCPVSASAKAISEAFKR